MTQRKPTTDLKRAAALGRKIGAQVADQTGRMTLIAAGVTALRLTQAEAEVATIAAVEAQPGLRTAPAQVGQNRIVCSVRLGDRQPVLLVAFDGRVEYGRADLAMKGSTLVVTNFRPDRGRAAPRR